ncbi:AEC family transporter, partial [Thioclava sp. BHET1]
LPVTERAYGPDALTANYAIIALHSPFCYGIGITLMEILRSRGGGPLAMGGRILRAMFRNPLVIGISLGLVVNFTGLPLPKMLEDAIDMMTRAALPAALFGLGGILHRYKPEGDMRLIAFAIAVCLLLHPTIAYTLGHAFNLTQAQLRSAVITGAMAPGVNAYLFANMYGVGKRVAASTVLFGTACAVLTVWGWLTLLG